ncbi:DNA-binding protein [Streptomyces cyaneofuscatus]|uniref:DNA-binding protein n=1 Tax=Streptomyces cyaneofuscatus TaxID=66883 RepID=UPI0033E1114B
MKSLWRVEIEPEVRQWLELRIVLLTVFRKTRQREDGEVERARQAQQTCEADHGPAEHSYDRKKEEEESP